MAAGSRQRWLRIASVGELAPGTGRQIRVLGRAVAVFNTGDRLVALDGMCRHMNAPLVGGRINGTYLICKWHGWKYDLTNGRCMSKDWATLRTYAVKVERGYVLVNVEPIYQRMEPAGRNATSLLPAGQEESEE